MRFIAETHPNFVSCRRSKFLSLNSPQSSGLWTHSYSPACWCRKGIFLIFFKPRNETFWVLRVGWERLSACCVLPRPAGLSYSSWRSTPKLRFLTSVLQTAWELGHWQTENNARWLLLTHPFVWETVISREGKDPLLLLKYHISNWGFSAFT